MHIREAKIPALIAEGEFFMMDAQHVQQGRLHVVNVHRIFGHMIGKVIGFSMAEARLESPTRAPDGKAYAEVIAPIGTRIIDISCTNTVRPNSLTHNTIVSSSKPRCFKSFTKAAAG